MTAEPKNTAPSLSVDERVDLLQQSIEKEQEEYKAVVLEALKTVCTPKSSFEDLRTISNALEKDANALVAQAVSGGKTNISYRVSLKKEFECKDSSNAPALFCKVCFSFARWNPDRSVPYDLKRTENEFWIMGEFAKMMNA